MSSVLCDLAQIYILMTVIVAKIERATIIEITKATSLNAQTLMWQY